MPEYGDYLLCNGKTFRYIEPYQGRGGVYWRDPEALVEAVDDVEDQSGPWMHLHDDYYVLDLSDCRIVKKDDPQTFLGMWL